jgi:nucleobase:cation symporter-1, NCS1 family
MGEQVHQVSDSAPDQIGRIEAYGIETIAPEHRHGTPRELFWPWLGANSTFINMIAGGVLILLGLNLWEALLCVFVGNLVFVVVGFCSLPGPAAGTATLAVSRAAFGIRGNVLPNIFSWFATLGWETINLILGTLALQTLLAQMGVHTPHWMLAPFLLVMAILTFAIPMLGHATLVVAQKWLSYILTVLTIVMAVLLVPKVHWGYAGATLAAHGGLATWFLGLTAILGAGAISWVNFAADYSRYLPADASKGSIVWWVTVATVPPGWLYGGLGVVLGTLVDTSNPIANLPKILPRWFLFPFLLVVILGVIANNVMNSYSSGLNLLVLGLKVERYKSVFIDAVITITAAVIALFVYNFSTVFTEFLSLLVILLAPWSAVYLTDFWLRRGRYAHSEDLLRSRGGAYWYRNGIHWPAIVSLLAGVVCGGLVANTTLWQGPISTGLLGGADLSPIVGFIVGGGLYVLMTRRSGVYAGQAATAAVSAPVVAEGEMSI